MIRMFMVAMATRGNHELALHIPIGMPSPSPTDQMHTVTGGV